MRYVWGFHLGCWLNYHIQDNKDDIVTKINDGNGCKQGSSRFYYDTDVFAIK